MKRPKKLYIPKKFFFVKIILHITDFNRSFSFFISEKQIDNKSEKRQPCNYSPHNLFFKGTEIFLSHIYNCPAGHQKAEQSDTHNKYKRIHNRLSFHYQSMQVGLCSAANPTCMLTVKCRKQDLKFLTIYHTTFLTVSSVSFITSLRASTSPAPITPHALIRY